MLLFFVSQTSYEDHSISEVEGISILSSFIVQSCLSFLGSGLALADLQNAFSVYLDRKISPTALGLLHIVQNIKLHIYVASDALWLFEL